LSLLGRSACPGTGEAASISWPDGGGDPLLRLAAMQFEERDAGELERPARDRAKDVLRDDANAAISSAEAAVSGA